MPGYEEEYKRRQSLAVPRRRSGTITDRSRTSPPPAPIPPDDSRRNLARARPDEDRSLPHIGMVGDTYTILLKGEDTAGRFCLIDI